MKALDPNALKGKRLGVPRMFLRDSVPILETFNASLDVFRALGAEIVDPAEFPCAEEMKESQAERIVLKTDFKVDVTKYISELLEVPTGVKNLADLIEFNKTHADLELIPPYHDDQSTWVYLEYRSCGIADYLQDSSILIQRRGMTLFMRH